MKTNLTEKSNTFLEQTTSHLAQGDKARTGVKPGTSEKIEIPASKYPAFKPVKSLKDRLE